MGSLYLGEAAGARILRYGVGFAQVGDPYAFDVKTWDLRPAGEVGDVNFRTVDVLVRHKLGYAVEVTPIVDGEEQTAQLFTGGAPPGGQLEETVILQAAVEARGAALAARVRTTQLLGETELVDVQASFAIIRQTP